MRWSSVTGADVIARHPRSYEHQQIDVCPPTGPAHAGLEQIDRPIRDEAKLARHDPAMLAAFRALRLNQGTSDVEVATLLDAGLWASIEGEAERAGVTGLGDRSWYQPSAIRHRSVLAGHGCAVMHCGVSRAAGSFPARASPIGPGRRARSSARSATSARASSTAARSRTTTI